MKLNNIFEPETIAIIGASDHPEKVGGVLMDKTLNFKGKIIPINPNHKELFGIRCYKKISDYPKKIDLGVIAIPKESVLNAVEECGKKGIKTLIIISAGFSESGNVEEEEKLKKTAKKYDINFLGPNCFGIFNPENNLDLTFSKASPNKMGDTAFISQSGALWSFISDLSIDRFGFSKFISLGNAADIGFCELIKHFSTDKKTKNIVLYVEKLRDGNLFIENCRRAIKNGKKIYAVKAGKSREGSKAAFSHTGSLASDYEIYRGMFKQSGVELCSTLEEAFEKSSLYKFNEREKILVKDLREGINLITNAGGAGALASDYLSEKDIKVLEVKDILGTALAEDYKKALEETKGKNIMVILTTQSMSEVEKTAEVMIEYKKENKDKSILALFLGDKTVKVASETLKTNNIPCFNTFKQIERNF